MNDEGDQRSLYDPQQEHDSCGVGFVADINGRPQRRVVELALAALANLEHRGAIDADGKTGDGAGVLSQLPEPLFRREAARLRPLSHNLDLAVGVFFLPQHDHEAQGQLRRSIEQITRNRGLSFVGWRQVPVNQDALGTKAARTMPRIEHALFARSGTHSDFESVLYLLRREIEQATSHIKDFYIPSLSSRGIVYKGLMVASQLSAFYPDLRDPEFEAAHVVFHQRYSTNTIPNWSLAQPFRLLAHNGEINTIGGNRIWMEAREPELDREIWGADIELLKPTIQPGRSDSSSMDNVAELLVRSGRDPLETMMMLMPEAGWDNGEADTKAFYEYASCLMEPWDGPAALAFSDGRFVGAALDRNGLRPARYAITEDGLIAMASEAGAVPLEAQSIVSKGRLGPGEMIAVDTRSQRLFENREIKVECARRKLYQEWVRRSVISMPALRFSSMSANGEQLELATRLKAFGYTVEDRNRILEPMFTEGKEPVGSMGDDTPLAVLSARNRPLYHYFKQRFAQVTNPAIDPIRERAVMSQETLIGRRPGLLDRLPADVSLIKLRSPILTDEALTGLVTNESGRLETRTIDAVFETGGEDNLEAALEAICEQAVYAVDVGASVLVVSDRKVDADHAPIPMLLAVSAVNRHLIRAGKRMRASIVAEAGDAREDHHVACLIGYGASAVNPYLAFELVAAEVKSRGMSVAPALNNYVLALETGLLKIMAKMGIATAASYCGSQVFEAVGLAGSLIDKHFTGTVSRMGGASLIEIARDVLAIQRSAFGDGSATELDDAGYYRFRNGGEFHSFNPSVFRALHRAIKAKADPEFNLYSEQVNSRPPATIRDLLEFGVADPIDLEDVEPAASIIRRFSVSGMSHGALSREAHETIAIAMNRLGARSNSGEGGEDPGRFNRRLNGDNPSSRIKQVASARFGVTPLYLVSADELEIKISQGSKPGEGGQLPGHKVTKEIAEIRHSVPGITLISPPPHHDIYSIEDLAQLIYDLREINPSARIAVKLVSESGVGTVAAGVAKAHADVIHIAGHDGGTGASPLGSIKNAGSPWELGLAETHQVLAMNGLRQRVRLRADGGLKTARDIVIAALLGADEFGFATAPLVALGCVMARQCHLNTCPVGIATQDRRLRERFAGKPEMIVGFFVSLAESVRTILASLGLRSIEETVGRSDLLAPRTVTLPKRVQIDLDRLTIKVGSGVMSEPGGQRPSPGVSATSSLNQRISLDATRAHMGHRPVTLTYDIRNTDRAAATRLAGDVARRYGADELPPGTIDITFRGSAGQSFGAFLSSGIKLTLVGEANDYVAKGMAGGEIAIRPPDDARFDWSQNVIVGNTVMYGATGGSLFVAGRAGERFCVRNSGGSAVVEGVGDHGCEYMTGGAVVILGEVGRNFAAGMTGGIAYVLDSTGTFEARCNRELIELEVVSGHRDEEVVRRLVGRHYELTGSPKARAVLWEWPLYRPLFWKVITQTHGTGSIEPTVRVDAVRRKSGIRIAAAE